YTASSFARTLVGMFSWALRPETHRTDVGQVFPGAASFHSHVPDTVLDRAVIPGARVALRGLRSLRWMQQGNVHLYLLYVLAALVLLLVVGR
ncbi:MAG: proton-conducting transporter membrane subunit, partial [Polyangiaceae bacterium]